MIFKRFEGWALKGAKTTTSKCSNCNNTADHIVHVAPYGPQFGVVFRKKPLAGMKKYFLVCSICGHPSRELTKPQALAMRG